MELRDIEVFLVVADELHFRRAGERLYLSTGRISQTVSAMERELGGALFERTSRRVELTELGAQFRADAGDGLERVRRAMARARAMADSNRGVLRVGYTIDVGSAVAIELATRCQRARPGMQVVTLAQFTPGFEALQRHTVDILLTWSPGGDTTAVTGDGRAAGPVLGRVHRALLMPADHALADRTKVSVETAADYELFDDTADMPAAFAAAWLPPATPAGRPIRRIRDGSVGAGAAGPISIVDAIAAVQRFGSPYLSVDAVTGNRPYPGLTTTRVTDLPPCLLVPVWQRSCESSAVRAFADIVDGYTLDGRVDPVTPRVARIA